MQLSRRAFLKTSLMAAAILSLARFSNDPIVRAAAEDIEKSITQGEQPALHIVWVQGQACSGCTVSLLNSTDPSIVDVLIGQVEELSPVVLDYHPTIMPQWGVEHLKSETSESVKGWSAVSILRKAERGELGPYVLVVEGAVPDETLAGSGRWCTIGEDEAGPLTLTDELLPLAKNAAVVLAVGSCAAFGGIPHGSPNPTGTRGVMDVLGKEWKSVLGLPVINIPGCPPAGDWIVKTVAHLLLTVKGILPAPKLDEEHRPTFLYGWIMHDKCPRGSYYAAGQFINRYGEPYCVYSMGCKGPIVRCPITVTGFVEGIGACSAYGSPCIGCTMREFPDPPYSPFLKALPAPVMPPAEALAAAAVIGVAAGAVGSHMLKARKKVASKSSSKEG